jgi:hypothetical protein
MAIKYLYIDDNPTNDGALTKGFLSGLKTDQLDFDEYYIWVRETQDGKWKIREDLEHFIKENSYQGILFDWNLTASSSQIANGDTSVGLAQHIRQIISFNKEGVKNSIGAIKDIPLVLCSSKGNIKEIMDLDKTGADLFDYIYHRDEMIEARADVALHSLSKGYEKLNEKERALISILHSDETTFNNLDIIFQEDIKSLMQSPSHEIARFILRELIEYQGLLIDEDLLAARLGVDIEKSGEVWVKLKKELELFKYQGVFEDAWERWWWLEIEEWLSNNFPDISFQTTKAVQRVQLISGKFNLEGLKPAQPLDRCDSDEFWTICYATKKPLDFFDGFLTNIRTSYPWQDDIYVSNKAVLDFEGGQEGKWKISPTEKNRLKKYKTLLNSEES